MNHADWLEFEVTVPAQPAGMRVRIGAFGERWVAAVEGVGGTSNGIGATARSEPATRSSRWAAPR